MITEQEMRAWLRGRLPDWFEDWELALDREEITITGRLPAPEDGPSDEIAAEARGRIGQFRERTRGERIAIAADLQGQDGRKVAWAVTCGPVSKAFTRLSVPVMTRLRQPERQVLDTLVAAGVARSRAEALGWCVRLVGEHAEEWLSRLRAALLDVEDVRRADPLG
jgi:hypothetical protein